MIAGDNLFDFSLADFVAFWRSKGVRAPSPCATWARSSSRPTTGSSSSTTTTRVVDFEEKPADPPSTLAATATYLFHREHARLIAPYLEGEHGADQPGRFVGWLQRREPVYGWPLRRHLVRHRESRAAARGGQPPAGRRRPACARPPTRPTSAPAEVAVCLALGHRHDTRSALAFSAWLVDLLLPRRCVACGVAADTLCPACLLELRPLGAPCCGCCGAPTAWPVERCRECSARRPAFATARAAVAYSGPARALVRGWKERGLRRVADLAAELVVAHVERPAADVITYIPPDAARQLRRGHHPAERLAAELVPSLGARVGAVAGPADDDRPPDGPALAGTPAQRPRSVRAATRSCPARVAVVDDVFTTGATAAAAARSLRAAGASARRGGHLRAGRALV